MSAPVPGVSEGRQLLTEAEVARLPWRLDRIDGPAASTLWLWGAEDMAIASWKNPTDELVAVVALIVWLRNNTAALLDAVEANQRVRELHHRTTEEGYAAICVWGDCDHDKAGECPTRNFDVCEHCMAVVDATGFADSGEVWPSAVLWPCPTIRMLGGESE